MVTSLQHPDVFETLHSIGKRLLQRPTLPTQPLQLLRAQTYRLFIPFTQPASVIPFLLRSHILFLTRIPYHTIPYHTIPYYFHKLTSLGSYNQGTSSSMHPPAPLSLLYAMYKCIFLLPPPSHIKEPTPLLRLVHLPTYVDYFPSSRTLLQKPIPHIVRLQTRLSHNIKFVFSYNIAANAHY